MNERDVLVSDIRVTAIGEEGQYIFDWVDQKEGKVEFLASESDYDDFDEEVERALNQNGVYVKQSQTKQSSHSGTDSSNQNSEKMKDTSSDNSGAFEPVGSTGESSPNESTGTDSMATDSTATDNQNSDDSQHTTENIESERAERHSFIVRMSDPSERREVIQELQSEDAKNKMELTGPYKVTYEVQSSGELSLIEVEDLGVGSEIKGE